MAITVILHRYRGNCLFSLVATCRNFVPDENPLAPTSFTAKVRPAFSPSFRWIFALAITVKIFSGSSNPPLSAAICAYIGIELGKSTIKPFPDGETFVKVEENVRGEDVFLIQSTSPPTNHHLMEMFIMMDALRRASAARITAVLPFYGYARQDRKDQPRVPITAKLVANLLVAAGANRILAKRRKSASEVESMAVIGEIRGKNALLVDDLTETAGTLTTASALLKRKGAKKIIACVSHAILNELGIERLRKSAIDELITTDTVLRPAISGVKLTTLSVAGLLGEAIKRIHSNSSVTSLFEFNGGRTS